MLEPRLRIYYGPEDDATPAELPVATDVAPRTVELPLGEVFAVLTDALRGQRGWLEDFADDTISISEDLYEVLLAYQRLRRPPA